MSVYQLFLRVSKDKERVGLTLQKAVLRLAGVFLWEPVTLPMVLYSITAIFFVNVIVFLNFLFAFRTTIRTYSDLTDFVQSLMVGLVFASSGVKLILMHSSRRHIKELIDFLESLPRLENYRRIQTMENVCMSYMIILVFVVVSKYSSVFMNGDLPFKSSWPFDTKNSSFGWWIAFITDCFGGLFCWYVQSFDTLLVMTVTLMGGHLSRLRHLLAEVGKDNENDERVMKSAIRLHVELLRGATLVNNCYNYLIMFQSIYAIVHAVVILFYMVKVSNILDAVATSVLLTAAYSQLLVYCNSGQHLTSEFEKLNQAVFDNRWYRSKLSVRKALVLMGIMSQRAVTINNYGIFEALNTTFLHSCQESFSYYVVFRTLEANMRLA